MAPNPVPATPAAPPASPEGPSCVVNCTPWPELFTNLPGMGPVLEGGVEFARYTSKELWRMPADPHGYVRIDRIRERLRFRVGGPLPDKYLLESEEFYVDAAGNPRDGSEEMASVVREILEVQPLAVIIQYRSDLRAYSAEQEQAAYTKLAQMANNPHERYLAKKAPYVGHDCYPMAITAPGTKSKVDEKATLGSLPEYFDRQARIMDARDQVLGTESMPITNECWHGGHGLTNASVRWIPLDTWKRIIPMYRARWRRLAWWLGSRPKDPDNPAAGYFLPGVDDVRPYAAEMLRAF